MDHGPTLADGSAKPIYSEGYRYGEDDRFIIMVPWRSAAEDRPVVSAAFVCGLRTYRFSIDTRVSI